MSDLQEWLDRLGLRVPPELVLRDLGDRLEIEGPRGLALAFRAQLARLDPRGLPVRRERLARPSLVRPALKAVRVTKARLGPWDRLGLASRVRPVVRDRPGPAGPQDRRGPK